MSAMGKKSQQNSAAGKKMSDFPDYAEKFPDIRIALDNLEAGYDDLEDARTEYDEVDTAYYNTFSDQLNFSVSEANMLRSGMCYSAVEIASRGMLYPVFKVETLNKSGFEERNYASMAKAALEWVQRESGFIDAYQESKEEWAKCGDAYRRPYVEDLGKGEYWPQYETLDPRNIILDPECRSVWNKSEAISASFWGHTIVYDEMKIKTLFGPKVLELAEPGAMVDTTTISERQGKNQKTDKKFYEVIEYQNKADGIRCRKN